MKNNILGIIGGGQLGRMTALAAAKFGIECHIFDPDSNAPAFKVCSKSYIYDYENLNAIKEFASGVDTALYEFENIPLKSAKIIEELCLLRPSSFILSVSQDRLIEKKFLLNKAKVQTAKFYECNSYEDLVNAKNLIKGPSVLKTRRFGYDGKGQIKIDSDTDLLSAWKNIGSDKLILEEFISFKRELSIIIARDHNNNVQLYDTVDDIGETKNLASQYPNIVKQMQIAYDSHLVEIKANKRPAQEMKRPANKASATRPFIKKKKK